MLDDCRICQKHRGAGPLGGLLVLRTERFWVYHAPPDDAGLAALGHLYVEADRHAPYLADLTGDEAAELGRLRTDLASALRAELGAEFVFAAVIGTGVAHFHEHLLARHPGTARDVPWHQSDEAAPRADAEAVRALAERLRTRLGDVAAGGPAT